LIFNEGVMKRLTNLGFSLELNPNAKPSWLIRDMMYNLEQATAQGHPEIPEDPLAEEILNLNVKAGDVADR